MLGYAFVQHFGIQDADLEPKMINLTALADLHPAMPRIKARHESSPDKTLIEDMPTSKDMYRNTDVILLIRDPRDISVSNHFQRIREAAQQKRWHGNEEPYRGTIQDSIRDRIGGLESLYYYDIWAASRDVPRRMLVVRYEDLWQGTEGEVRRVLNFLGFEGISDDTITMAVRYASFDNMRRLELSDGLRSEALRP